MQSSLVITYQSLIIHNPYQSAASSIANNNIIIDCSALTSSYLGVSNNTK